MVTDRLTSRAQRIRRRALDTLPWSVAVESRSTVLEERRALRSKVRKLRGKLRGAEAEIKELKAANLKLAASESRLADGRSIDDLGYLFIVTYGRSGSTLLQGILNSIKDYDIHGENRAATHNLFEYFSALNSERERNTRGYVLRPQSSWYGIDRFDYERALADLRHSFVRTVLCPNPNARVVGFKEIRWFQSDHEEYFNFLQRLFPGARFLINTRHHEDVAKSKWWANAKDPLGTLARWEKQLDNLDNRLGEQAFRVHYDDYITDPDNLKAMFAWLGEPYDRDAVQNVLQKRHSY